MTLQNPALFISGQTHPAEDVRRWISAMIGDGPGIVLASDFAVTQNGTPNMTTEVASGRAFIPGTESSYQGVYFTENRGAVSLSIDASDSTNARKDLIVLQVEDGTYAGATYAAKLAVVTGTPAASPVEPTAPDNCLTLAMVDVAAGVTAITDADIEDRRRETTGLASALGGTVTCTSTTRPSAPRKGQQIFEEDSGKVRTWNGSSWAEMAYTSVVTQTVPAGSVMQWVMPGSAPAGWAYLDGQSIASADTAYPDLWAAAPAAWKSGSTLTLPSMKGRVPVHLDTGQTEFNSLELAGGSKTRTLARGNIPKHYHEMDHNHPSSTFTTSTDTHAHDLQDGSGRVPYYSGFVQSGGTTNHWNFATTHTDPLSLRAENDSHNHTVAVNLPNFTGNTEDGSENGLGSAAFQIMQPYFVLRFIIKL